MMDYFRHSIENFSIIMHYYPFLFPIENRVLSDTIGKRIYISRPFQYRVGSIYLTKGMLGGIFSLVVYKFHTTYYY